MREGGIGRGDRRAKQKWNELSRRIGAEEGKKEATMEEILMGALAARREPNGRQCYDGQIDILSNYLSQPLNRAIKPELPGADGSYGQRDEITILRPEQRMADLYPTAQSLSLARWLRGRLTGDWSQSRLELEATRDMGVDNDVLGGLAVPQPPALNIIDLARNQARVLEAGALTVPMTSSTLAIGAVGPLES